MTEMFDMALRAQRRDRAARRGADLFVLERAFDDCLERIGLVNRRFDRALILGCPDPGWRDRLSAVARAIEVRDPGPLFAAAANGEPLVEDQWLPPAESFDLVLAVGTLDTVNALPLALRLLFQAMRGDGLLIGAMAGGDTLPLLRQAMRAADSVSGAAAPHVHPRIEASALAPLLASAGFAMPVVDVDRIAVRYASFDRLIADLRAMGATNVLAARPRTALSRAALAAARVVFDSQRVGDRATEQFELLHFAAWRPA